MSFKKTVFFRFIFYSALTAGLILLGYELQPEETRNFFAGWTLWREPIVAGVVCGLVSALLGVYILLNRIVFISLAISQSAGLGILLSLFLGGLYWHGLESPSWSFFVGLTLASLTAVLFARLRRTRKIPDESIIGLIYVAAAGFTLLLGDRVSEGHHNIDNLLFGNAVAITSGEMRVLLAVGGGLFFLHWIFRREFLYCSTDPEFMRIKGVKSRLWITLLYFSLVLGITLNLRALGALPVFALMVIPPIISLRAAQGVREAFILSFWIGVLLPPLGYYFSFLYSFPTGASLIAVGLLFLLAAFVEWRCLRFFISRRSKASFPQNSVGTT